MLLLIDRELPFQIPPPSPVAVLPLMVLPSIVIGPRFAKTPPPTPIAACARLACRRSPLSLMVAPAADLDRPAEDRADPAADLDRAVGRKCVHRLAGSSRLRWRRR